MVWTSFSGAEVAAMTEGFFVSPGERDCPGCGKRRLRTYVQSAPAARRPTLVTYVWCAGCAKFVGMRSRHPEGLAFTEPVAPFGGLAEFLTRLDELWDAGVLPQSFSVA